MTIEALPVGSACNLQCRYCYENGLRDMSARLPDCDLDAVKAGLDREGKTCTFSLFGGEPLIQPREDLIEMLRWAHETRKGSSVQTNGTLIDLEMVRLFQRYNVGVGLSIDGPAELNDARWAGTETNTRKMTDRSFVALDLLFAAGMTPSLIVTLNAHNASAERLPRLLQWFRELDAKGLKHARLHLLEAGLNDGGGVALSEAENTAAYLMCLDLQGELKTLKFDVFTDAANQLLGKTEGASCIWNACDPLNTQAVQGVGPQGERLNCGHLSKDGVAWLKADDRSNVRTRTLYETPREDGGCKGCRFFFACKGGCAGSTIDGDWRNRSAHCATWTVLLERLENNLANAGTIPLSWPSRNIERLALEKKIVEGMPDGNRDHGDHWDAPDGYQHSDAGVLVHGDAGTTTMHGDTPHGDHMDAPAERLPEVSAKVNGFSTGAVMASMHEMVLSALAEHPPHGTVLDLGCGDGTLLRRVRDVYGVAVLGIECDMSKCVELWILHGNLQDVGMRVLHNVDTIIVSERRFAEIPLLEAWVRSRCRQVLLSSYDEPLYARVEQC